MLKRGILLLTVTVFLLSTGTVCSGDDEDEIRSLYDFLAGSYTVIGKALNSQTTYRGKIKLIDKGDHLIVTRRIRGKSISGIGKIENARGADGLKVLRVRYRENGKDNEITYLWQSDPDNYARLSGYLYERGKQTNAPGLEALFIEHQEK